MTNAGSGQNQPSSGADLAPCSTDQYTAGYTCALATYPDELIAEIVSYTVAADDVAGRETRGQDILEVDLSRAKAPFAASGVCANWRRAVTNTATLWHYVAVPPLLDWTPTHRDSALGVYVSTILQNSQMQPIDVIFDFLAGKGQAVMAIVALIAQHASRWRRMSIMFDETLAVDAVAQLLVPPTPALKFVWISNQHSHQSRGIRSFSDGTTLWDHDLHFLPHVPRLVQAVFVNVLPRLADASNGLYPHLRGLQLDLTMRTLVPELWTLLQRAAPMIHSLRITTQAIRSDLSGMIAVLPELRELWIRQDAVTGVQVDRLPTLSASPIEDLLLAINTLTPAYRMLRIFSEHLAVLRLHRTTVGTEADLPILHQLHSLRHVYLWRGRICSVLIQRLLSAASMWPELRILELDGARVEDWVHDSPLLVRLVHSRNSVISLGSAPPRFEVLLGGGHNVTPAHAAEIARLSLLAGDLSQ
ncbi:hypothetical protein BKA62DRAFT_513551 [Auriculariales sp. MPI-PUGE-AT-0066]|nr:hypothetical protein BKA62DRAFT_513551 [Auriculariales sp. MPI-PUGE-AT-0066]